MRIIEKFTFDEKVEGWRIGFSWIGKPLMSVFVYWTDGLLIDSGQSNMRKEILEAIKDKPVNRLVLTHHHEDHSGNAAAIEKELQIPVNTHPLAIPKMADALRIKPYQRMVWGKASALTPSPYPSLIETDSFKLKPVHTPGHCKDHTAYLDEENGRLFSGDLFLGEKIKFFRYDERMLDQINSLKKILKCDFEALFCGHNPSTRKGKEKLRNKLSFLEDFYGQTLNMMKKGLPEKEIIKALDSKNGLKIKLISMWNVSRAHMVRSAIRDILENEL